MLPSVALCTQASFLKQNTIGHQSSKAAVLGPMIYVIDGFVLKSGTHQ